MRSVTLDSSEYHTEPDGGEYGYATQEAANNEDQPY